MPSAASVLNATLATPEWLFIPTPTMLTFTTSLSNSTLEAYLKKERERMGASPCYGEDYTLRKNVSMEKRMQQKKDLDGKIGYID